MEKALLESAINPDRTGATTSYSTKYFHGDNGPAGAGHQTGRPDLVAIKIESLRPSGSKRFLEAGREAGSRTVFLTRKAELLSTPAKAARHWKACDREILSPPLTRMRKAGQVYFRDLENW
jgi:hypothetical protein